MSTLITSLGYLGLIVATAYFVIYDRMANVTEVNYVRNTRDIFFVSVIMIAGGYILKYVGPFFGMGYGRCKKCGKRIEKQEMFCFDHRLETIRQAQDRTHASNGKR